MTREQLVDRLRDAFRAYGYEGATVQRLTEATGMGRGSLYHHFPGGKEQMAQAVLEHVADWFENVVFAPLRADGPPAQAVAAMLENLTEFYACGEASCLAGAISLGEAKDTFAVQLRRIFRNFIVELAQVCERAGQSPAQARRNATDAVVRIEGALVVARGTGDMSIFADTIAAVPEQLLGPGQLRSAASPSRARRATIAPAGSGRTKRLA
jgi:AcrR family transcriptional regulator